MLAHVPWRGDAPPVPIHYKDPGTFTRRDDGTWCRRGKSGRLYLVSAQGERVAKPRFGDVDERHTDKTRPPSVSPHFLWKVLAAAQRVQWWKEKGGDEAGAPAA